jgi:hypothetical protein
MKKILLSVLLTSFFTGGLLYSQDVRFYYQTNNSPGFSTVSIYAYSVGAANDLYGIDFQFYYDNTNALLTGFNDAPLVTAGGLNWGTTNKSEELFTSGQPPNGSPVTVTGFASYANFDQNNATTLPPFPGTLLLQLNFTVSAFTEAFFAGTVDNPGVFYYTFPGIPHDMIVTGPQAQALPLDLISFNAQPKETKIGLNWNTANEVDFSHFELERSMTGRVFEPVTRVPGKGGVNNFYRFEDDRVRQGVPYYYRLKMVDEDGSFEYSPIVNAKLEGRSLVLISASPNPTPDFLFIDYAAEDERDVEIRLVDMSGKLLHVQNETSLKGLNRTKINMNKYAPGVYFMTINNGVEQTTQKVVKAN